MTERYGGEDGLPLIATPREAVTAAPGECVRRPTMSQIGDRVEHTIDQRADVEHEIERGEAATPARGRLTRSVPGSPSRASRSTSSRRA